MKKLLLTALALLMVNATLFAQDLEQDITYYKFINKLWTMSNAFDKVAFHLENHSVEADQTRNSELEVLERLFSDATTDFENLNTKAYKERNLKDLKEMLAAMELSLTDLKDDSWTEEASWQLNYNLVKMRLGELETNKREIVQLSRSDR